MLRTPSAIKDWAKIATYSRIRMSKMDICALLTELDPRSAETGLRKAREYLRRFSFTEDRGEERKRTIARAEKNWGRFLSVGLDEDLTALASRPFQWLRLAGEIEIEDHHHPIEIVVYPLPGNRAGVSIDFSSSLYEAMYAF